MNLMKMATGALTPILANKLAGTFGVPEGMVRKVLSVGLPVVLAMFMKRGATQDGADAIGAAMNDLPSNPLSALGDMLDGGDERVQAAGKSGSEMLASILGGSSSSTVIDKIAGYAGGDKAAVSSLLGIVGAGALGTLKATADDQKLDTAGALKLLASQKDELAAAIPNDLARTLGGSGLLPDGFQAPAAAAAGAKPSGGIMKWAIGAVVLLLVLWMVPQFFGGGNTADHMVVDGVNVGSTLTETLASVTNTLGGITDAESAQSALASLTEAGASLSDLQTTFGSMSVEGQSAVSSMVSEALPSLQSAMSDLLGNADISAILQPVFDGLMSTLTSMMG